MSFGSNSSRYLRRTSLGYDWLSPALVLGLQDARGTGTIGTRFGDLLKADKSIIFAFWRRTRKKVQRKAKIFSIQFLIFLDSGLWKDVNAPSPWAGGREGEHSSLGCLVWVK